MTNNKKRGSYLRKAREAKKLTQEELGNLIFYSDKTISAWEKGIYTPSDYETIIKLAEVLEISPLSIIYGEENTSEEEQLYSYLNYKKQTKLKIIIISIIFLITLITVLISFYLTNLRDTTSIYTIVTNSDNLILRDSFYLYNKNTSIISINKVISENNKYFIKRIELFYYDKNKKVQIISGPNNDYYLENKNRLNEYNIKNLLNKKVYLYVYTSNKKIKTSISFKKRKEILTKKDEISNISNKYKLLEELCFIYQDGLYIYHKDNITIRYNEVGTLYLVKENKDNNEYLYKRIKDKNIIYKKIYNNGKYKEKEITLNGNNTCLLQTEKDIFKLAECLNYLAKELK